MTAIVLGIVSTLAWPAALVTAALIIRRAVRKDLSR